MADEIVRERLVAPLRGLRPGDVAIVHGPLGIGRRTVIRQWAAAEGHHVLWRLSDDPVRVEPGARLPDVVVVMVHVPEPAALLEETRRIWPRARLVLLSVVGWPDQLRDSGIRPTVRVSGRDLRFTRGDVLALAERCGAPVTEADGDRLLRVTAGYTMFAAAVVRRATETGRLDDAAIESGCDRAMTDLAGDADRHLRAALDGAARTRVRAPFLQLGRDALTDLLERAAGLDLDPTERELVRHLGEVSAALST